MNNLIKFAFLGIVATPLSVSAAVDLSPNAPDAKIATSKQYVDSGLGKKANKTDVASALALKADIEDLAGYATQVWIEQQGFLTTTGTGGLATQTDLTGKQDSLTCQNGEVMYFNGNGTYECRTLAVGEYIGE
jgi:hypothetical protein